MSETIWSRLGMEFDAFYTLESEGGQEIGGSRAGIALRDFGRFGVFLQRNGVIDGTPVLPADWIEMPDTRLRPRSRHQSLRRARLRLQLVDRS